VDLGLFWVGMGLFCAYKGLFRVYIWPIIAKGWTFEGSGLCVYALDPDLWM